MLYDLAVPSGILSRSELPFAQTEGSGRERLT